VGAAARAEAARDSEEEAEAEAEAEEEEEEAEEEWGEGDAEEGGAAARRVEQVLARRWATSGRKGAVEFLVKFKGLSYLHVAWCRDPLFSP